MVLTSRRGTLAEQVARAQRPETALVPLRRPTWRSSPTERPSPALDLELFNGLGGFAQDGREYVVVLHPGQWTPAPWINVIANPGFGFQVSECGAGYTWAVNSRENQLTAWSNDAVSDPPGETIYVRDEETGELWGPTALPVREETTPYVIRHGQGYTRFEHLSHGIALELLQLVPLDDPIKISRLTLTNTSGRPRRLSVTACVEWVLGVSRGAVAPFTVTEIDPETGAMFARNAWRREFGTRVAFADLGGRHTAWTADRTEFLGRNGAPDHPAALAPRQRLSGRVGAGLDPCGALQATVELPAGGRADVVFFLGEAASAEQARALIVRYRAQDVDGILRVGRRALGPGARDGAGPDAGSRDGHRAQPLAAVPDAGVSGVGAVGVLSGRRRVRLPRSAAGRAGADRSPRPGWRASTCCEPRRGNSARATSSTGGTLPAGAASARGSPTTCLWLPYVVARYVDVTGDGAVLDEVVPFLDGPAWPPGQLESYFEPRVSAERARSSSTAPAPSTRA